jgi:hypothetical protein
MIINTTLSLTVGIALLVTIAIAPTVYAQQARTVVKHRPIVSQGDVSESWDARQNVIDSKRYEQLLRTNPTFRRERMRIECGSITDPQLHQSCIASFDRYGPAGG